MAQPVWVERLVVDAVHLDQLREHGGLVGVRDDNALESALARPRQKWRYEPESDLAILAAAYASAYAAAYGFGLVTSHAYRDGNKRTGFLAMAVFLGLNGFEIEAPEAEVVTVMLALVDHRLNEAELAEWVRAHVVSLA